MPKSIVRGTTYRGYDHHQTLLALEFLHRADLDLLHTESINEKTNLLHLARVKQITKVTLKSQFHLVCLPLKW